MWIQFYVPCPTPDGRRHATCTRPAWTASLLRCRPVPQNTAAASTERGTQATVPGSMHLRRGRRARALAAFFNEWNIEDEPGEVAVILEGDVGLVPVP